MSNMAFTTIRNTDLPKSFRVIRLELAREPGHPEGDSRIGYIMLAPLDADGKIDHAGWTKHREACRIVRLRPEGDERGHLVHRPGGSWFFRYGVNGNGPDDVGYHFSDEKFVVGEYASITDRDVVHAFRVVSVAPL